MIRSITSIFAKQKAKQAKKQTGLDYELLNSSLNINPNSTETIRALANVSCLNDTYSVKLINAGT